MAKILDLGLARPSMSFIYIFKFLLNASHVSNLMNLSPCVQTDSDDYLDRL